MTTSSEAFCIEYVSANIIKVRESDALDHPINTSDLKPIALTSNSFGIPSISYSEPVNVVYSISALTQLTLVPTTLK